MRRQISSLRPSKFPRRPLHRAERRSALAPPPTQRWPFSMDPWQGTMDCPLAKFCDDSWRCPKTGKSTQAPKRWRRVLPNHRPALAAQLIIPQPRDRWFKSSPRNQFHQGRRKNVEAAAANMILLRSAFVLHAAAFQTHPSTLAGLAIAFRFVADEHCLCLKPE